MPTEAVFWTLLSKKFAGKATERELSELDDLIASDQQWRLLYDEMMKKHETSQEEFEEAEQMYAAFAVKMQLKNKSQKGAEVFELDSNNRRSGFRRRVLIAVCSVAACLLIITLLQLGLFSGKDTNQLAQSNEVVTKRGSKSKISLPDGTQVWLNADTKLSYSNDFIGKTREVHLTGEAFFDVAHDENHPFIIHANTINIKVLGTAFNVRSYPQDKTVETSLIRGKIEVNFHSRPDEKIILHPNEKLIVNNLGISELPQKNSLSAEAPATVTIKPLTVLSHDTLVAETAWMNDEMVFSNETLEQIALELERRFNITVNFRDELVKQYRYSAVFGSENIERILHILSISKRFNYVVEGKKVTISK